MSGRPSDRQDDMKLNLAAKEEFKESAAIRTSSSFKHSNLHKTLDPQAE